MIDTCSLDFRATEIDFNTYFESLVGVIIPENSVGIRTIRLSLTAGRAPYVRTKPFHKSQRILRDSEEGMEIELRLLINQELKTLLLSFSPDLRVLAPELLNLQQYTGDFSQAAIGVV